MAELKLSFSVMPSLLTEPLLRGDVRPRDVSLEAYRPESIDKLSRDMLELKFDIGEMAVGTFLKAYEEGLPITALPLFTSGRRFLQSHFFVSRASGITDLSQMKGRAVGVPQYWLSTAVWQRMILRQVHGVAPEDMRWVTWQPERLQSLGIPPGVELRRDSSGRGPVQLIGAGEVDLVLAPLAGQDGVSDVAVPAYPDRTEAQRDFYRRTGVFPIMHVTVMKRDIAGAHPWLAGSLCRAYEQAKSLAQAAAGLSSSAMPAAGETTREMLDIIGHDPWSYGIEPNRSALEILLTEAERQHLVPRRFGINELFCATLPAEFR